MSYQVHHIYKIILFILIAISVVSCGGGGGGSTPPPPAKDTTPPDVVATKPASEQSEIATTSFIKVTFSEVIATVDTDQVFINQYNAGVLDVNTPIALKQSEPFIFDANSKVLTIKPKVGVLQPATKYQVTLSNIKDTSGNKIKETCRWDFATVGFGSIATGKSAPCGKDPIPVKPGEVRNVNAVAGNGSVTLSWLAPTTGDAVTYYKIQKSIDNKQTFTIVNANLSGTQLTVTDSSAQNGQVHIYSIIAGNASGESAAVYSNSVTPEQPQTSGVPGAPQNVSASAGDGKVIVNWQAPNTGGTPTYYSVDKSIDNNQTFSIVNSNVPANTLNITDPNAQNGVSHTYRVLAGNASGVGTAVLSNVVIPKTLAIQTIKSSTFLDSQAPGAFNNFGLDYAFSADGLLVAVGERFGDVANTANIGTVQLFSKTGSNWNRTQVLTSQKPVVDSRYGRSVALSPDGVLLAIGEPASGNVYLYTMSGSKAVFKTLISDKNQPIRNEFGISLAFSPDSSLLAIGASIESVGNVVSAGAVHLFNTSTFVETLVLSAIVPTINSSFGVSVTFSPDGNYIAIGATGSPSTAGNVGTVHLFGKSVNSSWPNVQVFKSATSSTPNAFGGDPNASAIVFSSDSQTLAIGDYIDSALYLYNKSNTTWVLGQTLLGQSSVTKGLGRSVAFNLDGTKLAVSAYLGTLINTPGSGIVEIFKNSNSIWVHSGYLSAKTPLTNTQFGYSLIFSVDGTLAVAQDVESDKFGIVNIFNAAILP